MIKLKLNELEPVYPDIIYIVGLSGICFIFFAEHKFSYVKETMKSLEGYLKDKDFIRINYHVIINSKYFIRNNADSKKEIIMKNGTVLKVSRRKWDNFKQYK
jgi:DNA-binding LytR/AlgR family response regulator